MSVIKNIVDILFDLGVFINALLYLPQAIKIFLSKSARGLSLLAFLIFDFSILAFLLHGLIQKDWPMVLGMALSLLTCGVTTIAVWVYRNPLII